MKQVFKNNSGINVHEVPLPTPGENELLVAVEASVISTGTETTGMRHDKKSLIENLQEKKRLLDKVLQKLKDNGLEATMGTIKRKLNPAEQSLVYNPIGYSNAGTIIAKGRLISGFNIGDRVACAGSGIAAHAEYVTIPVNLAAKIPDTVSFNSAAFTTIGSIAMQGIRRAEVTFGETIVITGLGLLGLLAVQIAKAWGLVVIGLDLNPKRLDMAKAMGADHCFVANENETEKFIHELTNGNGADAVIIYAATKSSDPANQALRICRRKGRVVVVGSIGMELERQAMYMKELDFVMSTSYGPGRYDDLYEVKGIDYPIGYVRWTENRNMMEFIRLITAGQVDVLPLISNSFTIDQAEEAYRSLVDNPGQNISSLFHYHHETKEVPVSKSILYPGPVIQGKIRVGIIGAGGFVQSNHIPNILKFPELYELVAIANRTPAEAKAAGEKFKVRYVTTDYHQILNDPDIDMVVIGTRHNLHALQVADAIKAGKHVLVEKPLAMNETELNIIKELHERHPQVHVSVGFNRRYSPLTIAAKSIIERLRAPVVINYRINAGYIAPNIWVQDPEEGGGRIIGEVCHFIDLISYLMGSDVVQIQVAHVPLNTTSIKTADNLSVLLSYKDGSMGVITYIAMGGKNLPKERLEVFLNNSSMVIDDFNCLNMYNTGEKDLKLTETDKGHYKEIEEFSKLLRGEQSLIQPFEKDCDSTEITLAVISRINDL
jgi:predicted dehydrogenase/threonine dehydrogenase-like Zn-dependent dehydrogenase